MIDGAYFCSLGFKPEAGQEQVIPTGAYRTLRFGYDGHENDDPWGMHDPRQPDGAFVRDWTADERSGLIWPAADGLGILEMNIIWLAGDYQEVRDVFVRNLIGDTPDWTAYDHRPPSKGENPFTKTHMLKVYRGVPLALQVAHDAPGDARVRMAQFKLTILPLAVPPVSRNRVRSTEPMPTEKSPATGVTRDGTVVRAQNLR